MAPKKAQKMSLGDFMADQALGSWADEMEDMPVQCRLTGARTGYGMERREYSSGGGFGNDRGYARTTDPGYAREQLPLPTKPPFTAHLGNLSFDATEGDVHDFFAGCDVTNVRIVEDKLERKPKGFGYVEFGTLDGLKKALELNGQQFQGRNIRISVADPPKDRGEARDITDWSRKGPLPDLPQQQRSTSGRGFGRNFESGPGSDFGGGERRQRTPFEADGKVRDFGNWERKGPLSPPAGGAPPMREGGRPRDAPRERRESPAWGEGRPQDGSQEGSRPPRREFQDRPQYARQPTEAEMDNQWRSKMRPDPPAKSSTPTPDASVPSSPAQATAPASRPKLNLAKRTVSEAQPSPTVESSDAKASPFGAARPIDTAQREKEIEEKRELSIRQKKEADDKVREEKRAKEAAAKEKAAEPKSPAIDEPVEGENGEEAPKANNVQILQRAGGENGDTAAAAEDAETAEVPANGTNADEAPTTRRRDFTPRGGRGGGSGPRGGGRGGARGGPSEGGGWRRGSGQGRGGEGRGGGGQGQDRTRSPVEPKSATTPTTPSVDEDGWSVAGRPKQGKRGGGNAGARPIAS
ncbi:hypothetical protein K402DRAFT_397534 [Aulographum hederae CBS 113979]|uniref:RRM domain-containing protein n=1 Tax=Aulographum hederae CBS 113979 TaxID=1176131 RepID=A0A6G1GNW2_9PEZI|nr:hypothetical protein K402DRAFT_397534 [Aulographum hederae CBS 113979]